MMYEINYDQSNNLVVFKIGGFTSGELHNQAWMDNAKKMKETGADKCLIDATEQKVVPIENQKWIKNVFLPYIEELSAHVNYKVKIARLDSKDIFNQASAQTFLKLVKENNFTFEYEGFSSYNQAMNWLLQKHTNQ